MKITLSQRIAFHSALGVFVGWTLLTVEHATDIRNFLAPYLAKLFDVQTIAILNPIIGVMLWLLAIVLTFAVASVLFRVSPPDAT